MSNSYVETAKLNCPSCGHTFEVETWLIIDSAERPDLLEKARLGSLHRPACPSCGFEGTIDTPLLIYRPDQYPVLLFSPSDQTNSKQEQAYHLFDLLAHSLGDVWQVSWLTNVGVIPRLNLQAVLNDEMEPAEDQKQDENKTGSTAIPLEHKPTTRQVPEDPMQVLAEAGELGQVMLQSINSHSPDELREILEKHPELYSNQGLELLDRLLAANIRPQDFQILISRQLLFQSCQEIGVAQSFKLAIHVPQMPTKEEDDPNKADLKILTQAGPLGEMLLRSLRVASIDELQSLLVQHPELYSNEALNLLKSLLHNNDSPMIKELLQQRITLHSRCQEVGVQAAISESSQASDPVLTELTGILDTLEQPEVTGETRQLIKLYERAITLSKQAQNLYGGKSGAPDFSNLSINLKSKLAEIILENPLDNRVENLERAIQLFQDALKECDPQCDPEFWAMAHNNLGICFRNRIKGERAENIDQSIFHYDQALKVYRRETYPEDWAMMHNNLGNSYADRINGEQAENLEESIKHFQLALKVRTQLRYPKEWAQTESNLALVFIDRIREDRAQNIEKSIFHFNKALKFINQQDDLDDWATIHINLSKAYTNRIQGQKEKNLELALQHSLQVLDMLPREISPEKWAFVHYNLGIIFSNRISGDPTKNQAQAIYHLQEALKVRTPEGFPEKCRQTALELGLIAFDHGDWLLANQSFRQAMGAHKIMMRFVSQRSGKELELSKIKFLSASWAYSLAKSGDLPAAVESLESCRTQLLGEALERSSRDLMELPKLGFSQLHSRYLQAVEQLHELIVLGQSSYRPPDWQVQIEAAQASLEAVDNEIRQQAGAINPIFRHFMDILPVSEIQKLVSPQAPLVYMVITSIGGLALLVSPKHFEALWLEFSWDQLLASLYDLSGEYAKEGVLSEKLSPGDLLEAFQQKRLRITGGFLLGQLGQLDLLETSLRKILPVLGAKLMSPLAKSLQKMGVHSVVLIPTGLLTLFPLHAASYQKNGQTVHFIDEFDVSYAQSAQALLAARSQLTERTQSVPVLSGVGNPQPAKAPLEYAQFELKMIAALFEPQSHPLYGDEAKEKEFLMNLPGASHVHLACHGQFNMIDPLESYLHFAGEDTLTLREVINSQSFNQARLVVLSACQTAITDFSELPDEAIGLPGGFLQAGVPGVVGTLWSVNDLSTALLMIKFYEYALHGNPKTNDGPMPFARALCAAQRWLRDVTAGELLDYFESQRSQAKSKPLHGGMNLGIASAGVQRFKLLSRAFRPFQDPYFWAPFVFYGV